MYDPGPFGESLRDTRKRRIEAKRLAAIPEADRSAAWEAEMRAQYADLMEPPPAADEAD